VYGNNIEKFGTKLFRLLRW